MFKLLVLLFIIKLYARNNIFKCKLSFFYYFKFINFPNDNADYFATSLLILYCSFSTLLLSSLVMISFCILSTRFFLKGLSDARVASVTKKEYGFAVHFCKDS